MPQISKHQCPDPTCGSLSISISDGDIVGDILECPQCAAEVEITSLDPVTVRLIEEDK